MVVYKFVSEPDDSLKCLICYEVPTSSALWHEACGKLFCEACILKYGNTKPCPNCRRENPAFTPDNKSKTAIGTLTVRCLAALKCNWEGSFHSLTSHQDTTCKYTVLPCPFQCKNVKGMTPRYYRKDLPQHQAACPYRTVTCTHCGVNIVHTKLFDHDDTCTKKLVQCPNVGCTATMAREEILEHVDMECQHTVLPCKYASIGCSLKRKRKDLAEHESDAGIHLEKAVKATVEANETIAKLERKFARFEEETNHRLAKLENKVPPLFTFTIVNFARKKEENRSYTSQSFYTGEYGYNLAIIVDISGSAGYHDYLSVYVEVKKGRNDNYLLWPFEGRVTITLLNQIEDKNHHSVTVDMAKSGGINPYGRPMFIAHKDLDYNTNDKTCYLQDDTLYFRVSVECEDSKAWLDPPPAKRSNNSVFNFYN